MNKLIEDAEILTIGKKSFDVSNVSMWRKKHARRVWDQMATDYKKEIEETESETDREMITKSYAAIMDNLYDTLGLYLIRQELIVLDRRFSYIKARIEYIKRYFLSLRYIYKSSETEYDLFRDWASFTITGVKKKDLETENLIIEMEKEAIKELQKVYTDPEQLMAVYRTFVRETVGAMNIPAHSPKVK